MSVSLIATRALPFVAKAIEDPTVRALVARALKAANGASAQRIMSIITGDRMAFAIALSELGTQGYNFYSEMRAIDPEMATLSHLFHRSTAPGRDENGEQRDMLELVDEAKVYSRLRGQFGPQLLADLKTYVLMDAATEAAVIRISELSRA